MTTTETASKKKITITMSERRPLSVVEEDWPIIARADDHDGQVECQANRVRTIRVREHEDGRRIVYGWLSAGRGGMPAGWRGASGGFLATGEDETVRAIRRIGGIIGDDKLADECIADLPAEDIDEPAVVTPRFVTSRWVCFGVANARKGRQSAPDTVHAVSTTALARMLALLTVAMDHCPAELQDEIRAAIAAGGAS
jgi:hypothetical protein